MRIPFNNQYIALGEKFYSHTSPAAVARPSLIKFNEELANSLGISSSDTSDNDVAAVFSGNTVPRGAQPVAMAYAGHQFGHFVPQLGDGRALLLGEVCANNGTSYGIQLKGSGQTYFSRNGDGRAALGPVLREYLLSESMAKLNVPTTRALAAVSTGENVVRENLLPGGVITRVASSFVRVGTFEYFRARGDEQSIRKLADFVIQSNYADIAEDENPYISLLQTVVERQAVLIAQWMQLGFIHGVMNTDNMSVVGETIDYGPCAFIDAYKHDKVFSSIDHHGRYAYNNQPNIALWNLTRLAECLIPLIAENIEAAVEIAQNILTTYIESYQKHWLAGMRAKFGMTAIQGMDQQDQALIESLFNIMDANSADFTLTFFHLARLKYVSDSNDQNCRVLFANPVEFDKWIVKWRERLSQESATDDERQSAMQHVNPVYIPRNHQVEAAIRAAEDHADFSVFHDLHEVLQNPYSLQTGKDNYLLPPEADETVEKTFCGT